MVFRRRSRVAQETSTPPWAAQHHRGATLPSASESARRRSLRGVRPWLLRSSVTAGASIELAARSGCLIKQPITVNKNELQIKRYWYLVE